MTGERLRKNSVRAALILLAALTPVAVALYASGCSYKRTPTASANGGGSKKPPLLTESYVLNILSFNISDTSLVRRAAISGEGTEKIVEIEIDRPFNWGDGTFEGALSSFVYKTLPPLFQYSEVSKVVITMYGVDQGIKSDDAACRLMVDRETANSINWSMVSPMSLSYFLTEYYINPKILENSNYSGSGIPGY